MKTIQIEIPAGKKAEWVNGVLTLVDEQVKDNRPVTERIKTFEDALDELGEEHPCVAAYRCAEGIDEFGGDIEAYLKLRIIAAALNEGWEPQFTTDEYRYSPWFYIYTKEEIEKMDENQRKNVYIPSSTHVNGGVSCAGASLDSAISGAHSGYRIAFKTCELAKYAGKQFIDIWADYVFKAE